MFLKIVFLTTLFLVFGRSNSDDFDISIQLAELELKLAELLKEHSESVSTQRRDASETALENSKNADITITTLTKYSKLTKTNIHDVQLEDKISDRGLCPLKPECLNMNSTYREIDGSCNNKMNPTWGQAERPLARFLPPKYGDDVGSPRKCSNDKDCPNARKVSSTIINHDDHLINTHTTFVVQWGQFIDHDISFTPTPKGVKCCGNTSHPDCLRIEIPLDDPFYVGLEDNCMEFVRSLHMLSENCSAVPRQQINQITAYIDASMVYGSNKNLAESLRTKSGGKLITIPVAGTQGLLPVANPQPSQCAGNLEPCFLAGDGRVNETPDLTTMHTIFVREHNRLAEELSNLNPHWDDEKLYQEARKIVGALMQHITYNEWLPKILGLTYSDNEKLLPEDPTVIFDDNTDGTVFNEFATAAFRFGHSMVTGILKLYADDSYNTDTVKNLTLSDFSFAPGFLYHENGIDEVARGLASQTCRAVDTSFTDQMSNKMFARKASFGLDIVAINIQRGREHGIGPYIDYLSHCGGSNVTSFGDLVLLLGAANVASLQEVYENVEDVDLFIGGIMEIKDTGSLVGPTFQCIIGEQFKRLKFGDRFFFQNKNDEVARFSDAQIDALLEVTLARIICDNTNINSIQKDVFQVSTTRKTCGDEIGKKVNLIGWTENPE